MNPPTLDQFSRQLVEILPLMFREFSKREDNVLTRGKISFPQMVALDFVFRQPKVKMTDLSKVLHIQMSSTTVLVDRLIREKMFERKRDENDRRLVWVSVTARGKKVLAQIMDQKRQSVKKIFGPLTQKEREQYLAILLKVKSNLISIILAGFLALAPNSVLAETAPLTLSEAYRLALVRSEDIGMKAEAIEEAQGRFYKAFSLVLPKANFVMTRLEQEVSGESGSGVSTFGETATSNQLRPTTHEKKFVFSQPLFSGFKEFAALQGAGAEKKQRTYEKRRAEELLFMDVMEAFYTELEVQRDLEVLNKTRDLLQERVRELSERARIGRSRDSEVASAIVDLKLIESESEDIFRLERVTKQLLEFYIGRGIEGGLLDDAIEDRPISLSDYLSKAGGRSDVKASIEAHILAEKKVIVAQSGLFPSAKLDGNYYTQRVGSQSGIDWDMLLTVDVPIFDGGQTIGAIKEAAAQRESARLNAEKTLRVSELDVETAYENFIAAKRQEKVLAEAFEAAKKSYELQVEEYRNNLVNNLEVLDALRQFQQVERRFNEVSYQTKRNFWKLKVAVGEVLL